MRVTFTHHGWFGVCPVHMADLEGEAPVIHPKHVLLSPLFWLSESVFGALFLLGTAIHPTWEPAWPLHVTGELPHPLLREFPDTEPY